MFSFEYNKDPKRRDPENAAEKVHQFVYQRTYTSGAIVVALLAGFIFGVVPLGMFSMLPSGLSKFVLLVVVANVIAFLPSRWLHNRYKQLPVDYIYEVNINDEQGEIAKTWQYYEGAFKQDFEIVEGDLLTWSNPIGKNVFLVNDIDLEEAEVRASQAGEYNDIEMLQYTENVEQQRLRNRKYARIGIKVLANLQTLEDKVKTEYFQSLVTKGMELTSYDSNMLMDSVKDQIPELVPDEDEDEDEVMDMLQDLSGADDLNMDKEIKITGSSGENSD